MPFVGTNQDLTLKTRSARLVPRTKGLGYGIYEVENSDWKRELVKLNQHAFPDTENWVGKHYLLLFHDSSFDCIAKDLKLEVTSEPYSKVFKKVANRIFAE